MTRNGGWQRDRCALSAAADRIVVSTDSVFGMTPGLEHFRNEELYLPRPGRAEATVS